MLNTVNLGFGAISVTCNYILILQTAYQECTLAVSLLNTVLPPTNVNSTRDT